MPQKTTEDIPIKNKYWYIIYYKDFVSINLYPVIFISKQGAKRSLKLHIHRVHENKYQVIKGVKLKEYRLKYNLSLGVMSKFFKYEYPTHILTPKERKNYRTIQRRRLRRMDILTLIKPKIKITEKPKQNRWKRNKQKVANSPGSAARIIQLERKSKRYFYLILKKIRSTKKGILFCLETLRYDKNTGELEKMKLSIRTSDLVKPFLLKDLLNLCNEKQRKQISRSVSRIIKEAWGEEILL